MDEVITFAAWWAPVLGVFGLAALFRGKVRWGWLAASVAIHAIYVVSILHLGDFIPLPGWLGDAGWNWGGKIASICATILVLAALSLASRDVGPSRAGFTFRQAPGSVGPSIILITTITAAMLGLSFLAGDPPARDPERLLYQATMPGLDEEPFFRGTLLATLALAAPMKGLNLFGARIGVAALASTALFGLGHGLQYANGAWTVAADAIVITGIIGFALCWIRLRTGSLLLPILGHNAINFVNAVF
ncbi:MAG: CPBP family intramembrane metalloprotease [Alphaproteobacteria bacterium]|nr:CPBP family intramembrane metalloprotease [Alphaproteobacteria bacterium]